MYTYFVIIIDEDGEMKDMRDHRWESSAIEDGQEYARLHPKSHVGIFKGIENIAQYFPDTQEWFIKTGEKWKKAGPEYLVIRGKGQAEPEYLLIKNPVEKRILSECGVDCVGIQNISRSQ